MIENISIKGFKCITEATLDMRSLTILAGPNGSGKSSVIQSVLLACSAFPQKNGSTLKDVVKPFAQFEDVASRISNASTVEFFLRQEGGIIAATLDEQGLTGHPRNEASFPSYEESLFHLSANRIGPEELSLLDKELRIGETGQYAHGFFELRKDKPLHPALVKSEVPSKTLKAQLAWWLSFILGSETDVRTEKVTSTTVKTSFVAGTLDGLSPFNTGTGNGYVLKLLIMCLASKPGDILLIENPEIHLHPGAQSRLGSLFAFLASRGVQLIIETHCEHLLNRTRYEVYKKNLPAESLVIYYKQSVEADFERLHVNKRGHFCDETGREKPFPSGFFDSSLQELLEIG
jgi:predicted ATPase